MMKISPTFCSIKLFLLLLSSNSFAQQRYDIPKGYQVYIGGDGETRQIEADFDHDGIKDAFALFKDKKENLIAALFLSNVHAASKNYYYLPLERAIEYSLNLKGNVVNLGSCVGTGRFCKTLKFRYDSKINDLRLIGYDEEARGNAMHDGAYTKSINLLTGKYEIVDSNTKKKKTKSGTFQVFSIKNMYDSIFDYLVSVD
ncbi:MAG: hypothetical protein QM669_12460 [Siphonobacter sp.]